MWTIDEGSALNQVYLSGLGQFDCVYSWGVLHHAGDLWQAMDNVAALPSKGGTLCLGIYNDQGSWSRRWRVIRHTYNKLPRRLRGPYAVAVMGARELKFILLSCVRGEPLLYVGRVRSCSRRSGRGMTYWHDLIDWVGGYPFEVAKPEEVFDFLRARGFCLERLRTCGGGLGCNEFVLTKE